MCGHVPVDMFDVNGLMVDWISSHIYWTDGKKRTVEVANYNGSNRHILSIGGLQTPRGIVVDPIERSAPGSHITCLTILYWTSMGRCKSSWAFQH